MVSEFPARYQPVERLGKGGGGEVWSARDRLNNDLVALKLLRLDADEAEMQALVREASALSGIEGLGVPRVLHFGCLPESGRAYMVRELVEGVSLSDLLRQAGTVGRCLAAVAQAADLLTRLHRALLLHGDIKPANIIVSEDGSATLVDLGLAAQWREGGARAEGLTPRYAAPELFRGEPLTPRAEVFALGASAHEVLNDLGGSLPADVRAAVVEVVQRAMQNDADLRFPSADEFAEALRKAGKLGHDGADSSRPRGRGVWSIFGIEASSAQLLTQVQDMDAGAGLLIAGLPASGRTTLARRLSWSLGVAGVVVAWLSASDGSSVERALSIVLGERVPDDVVLVVDDADRLSSDALKQLDGLRQAGARLVMVVSPDGAAKLPGATFAFHPMSPLSTEDAAALLQRMIPSLSDKLVQHIAERTGGLPGVMRALVTRMEGRAVVSIEDVERCLDEVPLPAGVRVGPAEIHRLLERGRFDRAAECLASYAEDTSLTIALARAALATGRGEPKVALRELKRVMPQLPDEGRDRAAWHLQCGRANLRAGSYDDAEAQALKALHYAGATSTGPHTHLSELGSLVADALAVCGLTQSLAARHAEAAMTLGRSVEVARVAGDERVLAVALGSLAFALQRDDKLDAAQKAHEQALALAERAGDAGHIATTHLNLASIAKTRSDVAAALQHLEAAVDMGRRSGRQSTVRQALLNLANLNLYLGQVARASASIEALAAERGSLAAAAKAQLLALEAEHAARGDAFEVAAAKCLECAAAYESMRRPVDAAEALLEGALAQLNGTDADIAAVQEQLFRAETLLSDSGAHRPLLLLARGRLAAAAGELEQAHTALDEAIEVARSGGQQEWLWRALTARAALHLRQGDAVASSADRNAALGSLEAIAAELPRDLREVYWNDPRRRALREGPKRTVAVASGIHVDADPDINAPTQLGVVREDRLTRLLEINRDLAGEYDLDRLLERVTDYAVALVSAERGFVLLRSKSDEDRLSVHAARDRHGDELHARFSRSIAERVVETGESFVAADALRDERVSDYVSVHSLMLKSVACVPIRSRKSVIGALYLETRMRAGAMFREELPTLAALADQVAIAIETARLVNENRKRAAELEAANAELETARAKLEELLGRRTEQLQSTKRTLKSAQAVLRGHFGYRSIVGTSACMRRMYAVVDRVKDADVPVLLTGDSGTGKEVIARTIHQAGPRSKHRMVGINCGAIPEHLLESELFGHVRGAFTGADRDKKGLFRELSKGTILLDEIGEMPQKMQAGLLRVLQEKVVRPVGGSVEEKVDTRVIAATHRNLQEMVRRGEFREDLYYRLNVIEIQVPSLRERRDDIPLLIDHFLRIFAARYKRDRRTVSRDALKRLMDYDWPGNVRQLENVLLNAWILSDEPELLASDFSMPAPTSVRVSDKISETRTRPPQSADDAKEQEREQILSALSSCNWNRAKAAEKIGMPRRTFYRRLKKYGIQ